jgi:hypothetical protein
MPEVHDPRRLDAAERLARRRAPATVAATTTDVTELDPLAGVRAELVQRGLAVTAAQLRQIYAVLRLDDPDSVAAVLIDRHQVTVVRKRTVPRRDGTSHTTLRRDRLPILRDAAELYQLRREHP